MTPSKERLSRMPDSHDIIRVFEDESPEADLPGIFPMEWEDGKVVYQQGELAEQVGYLTMGYAAACVEVRWGEGSMEQFAYEVDSSYSHVNNQRRVYRKVVGLEAADRSAILRCVQAGILKYRHLERAAPLDDGEFVSVLLMAHDENWTARRLGEEVAALRGIPVHTEVPEHAQEYSEHGEEVHEPEVVMEDDVCPHCGQVIPR